MQSLVIGVTSVLLGVLLLPPLIWVLAAVFLRATRGDGSPKALLPASAPCPLPRLLPQSYPLCVPHQGEAGLGLQGRGSLRKPLRWAYWMLALPGACSWEGGEGRQPPPRPSPWLDLSQGTELF